MFSACVFNAELLFSISNMCNVKGDIKSVIYFPFRDLYAGFFYFNKALLYSECYCSFNKSYTNTRSSCLFHGISFIKQFSIINFKNEIVIVTKL